MNARRLIFLVVAGLFVAVAPLVVQQTHAQTSEEGTGQSIVEQIGCDQTVEVNGAVVVNRACQVNDFINLFIYLSKWGMSILAVLATLMFIYGGFQFVTAGGRASKVDEGKRVLTGTVVGSIIALSAYVIINTTVTAVSGVSITSLNPFGPIGAVFGGEDNSVIIQGQTKPLTRPFGGQTPSGSGSSTTTVEACRLETSSWIRNCSNDLLQVYCADPGPRDGVITTLQTQLNAKNCDCGEIADGCFGKNTVACVRRFQIANDLPPSGVINPTTRSRIESGGQNCGGQDTAVVAKLPSTVLAKTEGGDSKCCVVNNGTQDLYCVGSISTRACQALGSGSVAYDGACGSGATAGKCGYCSNSTNPTQSNGSICFMSVSPYWCSATQITPPASPPTYFNNDCRATCQQCTSSLRVSF